MPRTYVSKCSRPYKRYDPLILKTAVEVYQTGSKSLVEIAKEYNIAKSALHRHVTRNMKNQGGQRCLSEEVERYIIKYINICSEWGYPMDTFDLRIIIKGYLDRIGLEIKKFNNNLPGRDYVECFLKRYDKEISERISENVKRSRAAVAPQVFEDYFKELQISLEGVPLCNIVNYDESNLAVDPGKMKVLTKRGFKYPERVVNDSKTSTSLMMAASADGTLLPCYVVYKATHLYNTRTSNGPTNCKYNRTSSGWFDGNSFEDWIDTVALPYFGSKTGKKILIGDNLSSHLSIDVIRKCLEHNVHFVFLPPNSTHLTQPLDVAFFRPMKIAWRDILFTWKKTEGRMLPSIPKNVFPSLLKKMLEKMEPNNKQNILAGFTKTGINPINKEKVLSRLPGNNSRKEISTHIISKLTSQIEENENLTSKVSIPISNVEKLKLKGKGIGKRTKTQNICNILPDIPDVIVEEPDHLKEQEENNLYLTDITRMPLILYDDFLVTEEIQIINEQDEHEQYHEIFLKSNDNNLCSDGNGIDANVNEVKTLKDTEQRNKVQLCSEKPQNYKKVPIEKKMNIISDQKFTIYKRNKNKSIVPKPIAVPPRRPSYYRNDEEILRDLLDAKLE